MFLGVGQLVEGVLEADVGLPGCGGESLVGVHSPLPENFALTPTEI